MAENLALTAGQNSLSFAQQGQLDWVAVARTPVSFTIDVLARYGRAGVEPITLTMGRAICLGLDLKPEAQKRLEESMSKLKTVPSYGKIGWFGFGLKHIIDDLMETEQGAACVALCGCLTTSYDAEYASQVLRKMCQIKGAPTELTPSIRQWRAIVQICAGSLTPSQFPHLLSGFERLMDKQTTQYLGCSTPPNPETLARAIDTLGMISRGALRSATYSGGIDCAWIAAVAQWMLCLGVEINDDHGNTVYRSKSLHPNEIAHVIINVTARLSDKVPSLTHRIFHVSQGKDLLQYGGPTDDSFFSSSAIRMAAPWESILGASFGHESIGLLLNVPNNAFYVFLKSFSLIPHFFITLLDLQTEEIPLYGVSRLNHGIGFLEWAMERLPELRSCIGGSVEQPDGFLQLNTSTKQQMLEAAAHNSLQAIEAACQCLRCKQSNPPATGIVCLGTLSTTIIHYLYFLSILSVDKSLYPSCTGLRMLYNHQTVQSCIVQNISSRDIVRDRPNIMGRRCFIDCN